MREGEAIVAAAESALPLAPPAAPEIDPAEAAVLFAAGYDAENIADTNPEERAEQVREAREQGVEPIDETEAARRTAEHALLMSDLRTLRSWPNASASSMQQPAERRM